MALNLTEHFTGFDFDASLTSPRVRAPADMPTPSASREKGVDGPDARRPGRRHGPGLLSAPASRDEVQLQRLGGAAAGRGVRVGAVPAGGGVQLQEVPPLQHQRYRTLTFSPGHSWSSRCCFSCSELVEELGASPRVVPRFGDDLVGIKRNIGDGTAARLVTLIVFFPRFYIEGVNGVEVGAPSTGKTRRSFGFLKSQLELRMAQRSILGREHPWKEEKTMCSASQQGAAAESSSARRPRVLKSSVP